MDVKTVCLGMLSGGKASGYDLKKEFESSFAHFFPAGFGSIYPALSSLAELGLVECEEIAQEGKPDRKVYRITEAGQQALLEALKNPEPAHKIRSEFLATIWFAHLMSDYQIDTVLDHRLSETSRYLEMFSKLRADDCSEWTKGEEFVVGFGEAVTKAIDTYVRENRHLLTETKKVAAV